MSDFVQFVNLRPLPTWFVTTARDRILANDNSSPAAYDDHIINQTEPAGTVEINGVTKHYGEFFRQPLSAIHRKWATENLPDVPALNIALVNKGDLWPHLDHKELWSLIWVVESGGPDVKTYWSQPKGEPLRPEFRPLSYWRHHQELEEVHSEHIPAGKWAIIPVNIVHGTKNQTSDRIILTAKLTQEQYENIILKYT